MKLAMKLVMKIKAFPLILALILAAALTLPATAATDKATEAADKLYALGLFRGVGTDPDGKPVYDLDRAPSRAEAVTLLVRLLGRENAAGSAHRLIPFGDVADWARPYIGYAYENGLTTGTSTTTFEGEATVSATQYLTLVLRALGYVSGNDFEWDSAWLLTDKLGITAGEYGADSAFTRGDAVIVSAAALELKLKDGSKTLSRLIQENLAADTPAVVLGVKMLGDTYYDYAEDFRNGYAFVILGKDCGYIDTTGKFTACYRVPDERFTLALHGGYPEANGFWVSAEGLYPHYDESSKLWGYGNIKIGALAIAPQYSDACPFSEGRAVVQKPIGSQRETWVIDAEGTQLFELAETLEIGFENGILMAALKVGDQYNNCVVNRDGKELLTLCEDVELGGYFSAHMVMNTDTGYISRDYGQTDPKYIGAAIYKTVGGKTGFSEFCYIDNSGIVTARAPEGTVHGWGWMEEATATFYEKDDGYGLFNRDGVLTKPMFSDFQYMNRGIAMVLEDSVGWYPIGEDGKRIGDDVYDYGGINRDNGLIPAGQNGKTGYIDCYSKTAIEFKYAESYPFSAGVGFVKKDGSTLFTLLNVLGEEITGNFKITGSYVASEGFYLLPTTEGYCHVSAVY